MGDSSHKEHERPAESGPKFGQHPPHTPPKTSDDEGKHKAVDQQAPKEDEPAEVGVEKPSSRRQKRTSYRHRRQTERRPLNRYRDEESCSSDSDSHDRQPQRRTISMTSRASSPSDSEDDWDDPVRYRAAYIYGSDDDGPEAPLKEDEGPQSSRSSTKAVLEVIYCYRIPENKGFRSYHLDRHGHLGHLPKGATRTRDSRLRIHSQFLVNAFRAVIDCYYPGQDFSRDTIEFRSPYRFLFHHKEKLRWYKDNHPPQHDQKYREQCNEHIDILLTELDRLVGKRYRQEEERIKRGVITFDNLWMVFQPGQKMFVKAAEPEQTWPAFLVDIRGGVFKGKTRPYWVHIWVVFFTGVSFERMRERVCIRPFEGEKEITSLFTYPQRFHKDTEADKAMYDGRTLAEQMAVWGERYWEFRKPRLMEFHGECIQPKSLLVNGRVMVDFYAFRSRPDRFTLEWDKPIRRGGDMSASSAGSGSESENERPRRRRRPRRSDRLPPQEKARESIISQGCECETCSKLEADVNMGKNTTYRHYDGIEPNDDPPVDRQNFFSLCDRNVIAFALKERRWVFIDIAGLSLPTFDQNLFEYLVLPRSIKDTLGALSLNNSDAKFSADFIRGKGEGQVFLLHGSPGVGKTCAAECIAEMAKRPLLSITSGDLGTKPDEFDSNLRMYFRLGEAWNAIVLIDEADIYFEKRVETDIERNGLVSILLRALEYYRGTIFLTTNRIGVMDEAFTSRIHVSFGFPDLTQHDRERIWMNNFRRLEKDTDMEISDTAKEYIKTTKIGGLPWNGRHIRNAFQTAVALAAADKSHNGKRLTEDHLEDVVRLYLEFDEYLKEVHKDMDPAEMAVRSGIRAPPKVEKQVI